MPLSFDRCGFPLVALPHLWLEVQLLPVTKVQFERFLAEAGTWGSGRYEDLLRLLPASPYDAFADAEREGLFLGGVLPEEALHYARWLGEGYDLPTVEEWRQAALALAGRPAPTAEELAAWPAGPARTIVEQLLVQLPARTLLNLSLMRGGLVEWVREGAGWAGLGAPRPAFKEHLWDPFHDVIRPVRPGERVRYVGFRLVHRL